MADKSTDKNKKNRPDTKNIIISAVMLAAAAAMLIWLCVQLWSAHTLEQNYGGTSSALSEATATSSDEPASEAPASEEPAPTEDAEAAESGTQASDVPEESTEAPASEDQETTPEPEYGKTFGLDTEQEAE